MYLSTGNYVKIEKALKELPSGEAYDALPEEKKRIIDDANTAIKNTYIQYLNDNKRAAKIMAGVRKRRSNEEA